MRNSHRDYSSTHAQFSMHEISNVGRNEILSARTREHSQKEFLSSSVDTGHMNNVFSCAVVFQGTGSFVPVPFSAIALKGTAMFALEIVGNCHVHGS